MTIKRALITGITGQDGAYLSQLLLDKGYEVHGLIRRSATGNLDNIAQLGVAEDIYLHEGDMTDGGNLCRVLKDIQPDEIYNLAAQSHVGASFDYPEYTANTDGLGVLRLLETIRTLDMQTQTRFYQASTSELFGNALQSPQNEDTAFAPQSPYATAKLYAYWTVVNYREAYGIYASNGILFNHESPLRGGDFVSKKITNAVKNIVNGTQKQLVLGNLDACRDWGHARDYVEGMWRILQHETSDDFVLATGVMKSVRDFVEAAFAYVDIDIEWQGSGLEEQGLNKETGDVLVTVSKDFYRPLDVQALQGDATKAKNKLGWQAKHSFEDIVTDMMTQS